LTDLLGPYFCALCFTEMGAIPEGFEALEDSLRGSGIPFRLLALAREQDHTGRLFPMYGATPGTVYLLRPDGYILARWRAPTCDVILHTIQWSLHNDRNADR
jgi:3-(3-hydroxy-phenyl)propionate hydroxylase